MKNTKILLLFLICFVSISCVAAQDKSANLPEKPANKSDQNTNSKTEISACEPTPLKTAPDEMKVIAEGSFAKMEEPFLFVARDSQTYAKLKEMLENLPPASEIDFEKQSVVAAFAGTKNTGGYSVEIKNANGKISVSVAAPPADAMVTEALTMPYKIVVVSLERENLLNVEASENWTKKAQTFKISDAKFESSGGIAGRLKSFAAEGTVNVYRFGDLITLDFKLSGKGADKDRKLTETASGTLFDGKINLAQVNAGSLSEGPKPPVKISGTINDNKLTLSFESLPAKIADGFQVGGNLKAVKQ